MSTFTTTILSIFYFYFICFAKADSMDNLLNEAAKNFGDFTNLGEPQTLDENEIHATKNDKTYSIYERSRLPISTSIDTAKFRIKSVDYTRPSECTENGRKGDRVVCPTSNQDNRWWTCLHPNEICDGVENCFNGEDENPMFCMFFKASMLHLRALKFDMEKVQSKIDKIGHLATR